MIITNIRKWAYAISTLAVIFFFVFPEPTIAVVGALILQTLAYITIAGKSPIDGYLLSGISILLIGLVPTDHPFIAHSEFFESIRWGIIAVGVSAIVISLTVILRTEHHHHSRS